MPDETKEIALIEKESTDGKLATNIDDLEVFVAEKLIEYTPENYKGDADAAKKDRATLNASTKTVSAKRIEIVKKALARFGIDTFESRCKKVEKDIGTAALALDAIVKQKEDEEKAVKFAQIKEFWGVQNFDLVPLEKVFDQRWLNKTVKNKDIFEEIEKKIAAIYAGIKTLETLGIDAEALAILKPFYLDTLDIGQAAEQWNRIKQNRERLAKEEQERKDREDFKAKQSAQQELGREEMKAQTDAPVASLAAQAAGEVPDADPMDTFTCKFTGKRSDLHGMRQYMIDHNIKYEKIEG
jgi:hypothetical protein